MKPCQTCKRKDVTESEADKVADRLNKMDIVEFERVMTDMGIADNWQTAFVCMDCLEYYTVTNLPYRKVYK